MSRVVWSVSITSMQFLGVVLKTLATSTKPCIHVYEQHISVHCFEFFIISYFARLNSLTILKFMHQTSLRELTTLGMKNAENLAIPSVRNDVSTYNTRILVVSIAIPSVRNDESFSEL